VGGNTTEARFQPGSAVRVFRVATGLCRGESRGQEEEQRGSCRKERPLLFACQALVYGSRTGEPVCVGDDPRFILAGRRILEVFWLGYWFLRLSETVRRQLVTAIVSLMREGILTLPRRTRSRSTISARP
jgi:hypothetical protein